MKFFSKVKTLFRKSQVEAEMAEEMRLHLEMQEEANRTTGMSPDEARYAARRQFGHIDSTKETIRDQRGWVWLEHFWQDVGYGLRMLRKNPGYTTVALLTLGLGIGANTAIFSLVNGVLLKPLPYIEPERIVQLWETFPSGDRAYGGISTLDYLDWKRENTVFDRLAALSYYGSATLTGVKEPLQLSVLMVSAQYFDVFGVGTALGRTFAPGEDQPGNDRVVVLSYTFWKTQFGADPSLIGRSILINGEPHTVIGVIPRGSAFDREGTQIWLPLSFTPENMTRNYRYMEAYARLKPSVTLEQARTQMKMIMARIGRDYPDTNKDWSVAVNQYATLVVKDRVRQSLYVLLAAVGMVLLIACANLANLTLARGVVREREVAIRASLGAGRWRLIRQFLTESLLLSVGGSVFGLAVGYLTLAGLKLFLLLNSLPAEANIAMDERVLLFTLALALLTSIICGLIPALQATRPSLINSIRQGGPGASPGHVRQRTRGALVAVEVALAFVLLTGAGLLIRSVYQLQKVDTGFDSTNVITARLPISDKKFSTPEAFLAYLRQIIDRLGALPGVRDVALTTALPMQGSHFGEAFQIAGRTIVDRASRPECYFKMVSPSYFRALGMNIIKGRALNERDVRGALPVTVINETMARKYFPNEDPIGKRLLMPEFLFGKTEVGDDISWEVVGVVTDEKFSRLDEANGVEGIYVTTDQCPQFIQRLVVRSDMDPTLLQRAIRDVVHEIDPDQALSNMKLLEQIKVESMGDNRFHSLLFNIFASLALLLAAVGIYGVVSYSVTQRTREIGIRAALGADSRNILALILRGGMTPVVLGLGIGLAGVFGLTRLLSSFLFGVGERDPITIAAVALILAAVALIACCIPARRAARVNPVVALRTE